MLVLRRVRKDPLAIELLNDVVTLFDMDETAAESAGESQDATAHVSVLVTSYSI